MRKLLPLLILIFAYSAFGQQPDRWHDLILDRSTPEDALKILGPAKKDDVNRLMIFGGISKWITKKQKEKIFRTLSFDFGKEADVQKAWLSFLDGKLVMINLDLKSGKISPDGLANIYGASFYPLISALDIGVFQKNYEQNQGKIYPKTYPTVYNLAAVAEKSFIGAMIANVPTFLGALGKSMGIPDEPNSFPGKVAFVYLISRTLENKDGADILK